MTTIDDPEFAALFEAAVAAHLAEEAAQAEQRALYASHAPLREQALATWRAAYKASGMGRWAFDRLLIRAVRAARDALL